MEWVIRRQSANYSQNSSFYIKLIYIRDYTTKLKVDIYCGGNGRRVENWKSPSEEEDIVGIQPQHINMYTTANTPIRVK